MTLHRVLYHIARADFLERIRRYSFLITLGITIYLGYIFVPPNHYKYVTMEISGHRGIYNSAYMGSAVALLTVVFLSLAGFYLVKNALDRDIQTKVGQILATTPLTKPMYTLGKMLSNFAVLALMVATMAVAAGAMQFVRGEDWVFHPWELLAPFLFITLPVMAVVASGAILFECVKWLRGGLGNVVYYFVWNISLLVMVLLEGDLTISRFNDPMGLGIVIPSMAAACEAAFPGCTGSKAMLSMGLTFKSNGEVWDLTTFRWLGVHWTPGLVLERLMWVGVAVGIAFLAARFFPRFDPAQEVGRVKRKKKTNENKKTMRRPRTGKP